MTAVQQRFRVFVLERDALRVRREIWGGPPPWTNDPILQTHRFCNVNREDDYVTRWIAANVRPKLIELNDQVVSLLLCRIFNEPLTLKQLDFPVVPAHARVALEQLKQAGMKLLRGAYMMPAHGDAGKGRTIEDYWMDAVEAAAKLDFRGCTSLAHVAAELQRIRGLGDFLANQVCADLRYTGVRQWQDWNTFVKAGPGTRRGVSRYLGHDGEMGGNQDAYAERLLTIREEVKDLPRAFEAYFRDPNNLSNCFCEFDKYERAREQLAQGKSTTLRKYGNPQP